MAHLSRLWRSLQGPTKDSHPPLPLLPTAVPQPFIRPQIGIALGGGFARGMAHIGVLKVLEEAGIPIDFIAGTSVGAVVGAIYCSGVSAQEIGEIAALIRFSDFARHTLSRYGLYSNDRMTALLNRILKAHTFEELKIPLAVTATEFLTGAPVVFTSGALNERVRASCAYPGVFCPVTVEGKLMVDGLLGHSVPATPLKRLGASRVISVYFNAHWIKSGAPRHVLDIVGQCFSIAQANASSIWRADTDCCIEPDVEAFAYDDFARTPELIRVGEEAARAALPMIQAWLSAPEPALLPALLSTASSAAPTLAKPLAIAPLPRAAA